MLAFLEGLSDGRDWLSFGGLETLMSYGVPLRSLPRSKEAAQDLRHALAEAVPQAHVDFFRTCTLPQNREHRINIDTGAFVSGRLTCLVLRNRQRRFLSTADDAQD